MAEHFLLSSEARTLSIIKIVMMSNVVLLEVHIVLNQDNNIDVKIVFTLFLLQVVLYLHIIKCL